MRAGGLPPSPTHEDVLTVEHIHTAGRRIFASDAAWVRTSGRPIGRAPGGYSRYLREDLVPLAQRLREPLLVQPADPRRECDPSEVA